MEWLIAHEDELNNDVPSSQNDTDDPKKDNKNPVKEVASTKNDDKTSDSNSADEDAASKKKITVEEAQRLINERQAIRAEEERKKAIENEKRRRVDGQKMAEVRAELQDQERINLAQQIRREKLEKELHRKQVLELIARDREATRRKSAQSSQADQSSKPGHSGGPSAITPKSQCSKDLATECRIALRFPDGSSLVHKFSPKEQLSAVRLYAQMEKNLTGSLEFIAPPSKKLTESMMNQTLESLGLCPASRLEVRFRENFTDFD